MVSINYISSLLLTIILFTSCEKNVETPAENDGISEKLPLVSASGNKLFTEKDKEFKVWGFNWGRQDVMLETYWTTNWDALVKDFEEMKNYGANTVRVPLQYHAFMKDVRTPDKQSLEKLKQLIKVAEENELYLIVSGLNAFVKEDQPEWYSKLNDAQRWQTQAIFWESVASAIGQSPSILSYDLMNEPVVAVDPSNGWLPGEGFGGFFFVQNIALYPDSSNEETMKKWIAKMSEAIRKQDKQHLITVGFLPFPGFSQYSDDLSQMSVHLYPKSNEENKDSEIIKKFKGSKPLVISEIFPMNCTVVELQHFIEKHNADVSGWVWHYNGKTLEELEKSGTMHDAVYRSALLKFIEMAPTQK